MSKQVTTVTLRWQPPNEDDMAVVARMMHCDSTPTGLLRVWLAAAHWREEHKAELAEAPND